MNKRLAQLACRRLELLTAIEEQRGDVAYLSTQLQKPLAMLDAGWKVASFIHRHLVLATCTATALVTRRRGGFMGLARQGLRLLLLYPSLIFLGLKYLISARQPKNAIRMFRNTRRVRSSRNIIYI